MLGLFVLGQVGYRPLPCAGIDVPSSSERSLIFRVQRVDWYLPNVPVTTDKHSDIFTIYMYVNVYFFKIKIKLKFPLFLSVVVCRK